jgi:hypothetical protein
MLLTDLPNEVLLLIISHLNSKNKCRLLSVNIQLYQLYSAIRFDDFVNYFDIHYLINHRYYNSFRKIQFDSAFNQSIEGIIPDYATHLEFDHSFNQSLQYIPQSVVSIELGFNFNFITNRIPSHVKNLTINRKITDQERALIHPSTIVKQVFDELHVNYVYLTIDERHRFAAAPWNNIV